MYNMYGRPRPLVCAKKMLPVRYQSFKKQPSGARLRQLGRISQVHSAAATIATRAGVVSGAIQPTRGLTERRRSHLSGDG